MDCEWFATLAPRLGEREAILAQGERPAKGPGAWQHRHSVFHKGGHHEAATLASAYSVARHGPGSCGMRQVSRHIAAMLVHFAFELSVRFLEHL